MKKALTAGLTAAILLVPTAAFAAPNGNANGHGCTLANGDTFNTPAAMLSALADRDGSFQETVEKYDFGTVANLIDQKCGA